VGLTLEGARVETTLPTGTVVLFTEQQFEPTPTGRLQKGIMGEFAEYEAEVIRERTMAGRLKKAVSRGVMPCYARPFGYHQITAAEATVVPEYAGRAGELIVIPEEAEIVRRVFSLCASGKSIRGIAVTLIAEGLRTRAGAPWAPSTIKCMLRNEAYVGRIHFGKVETRMTSELTATGTVRTKTAARPRSEWVEMTCPAIVSEVLFQACQRQLDNNLQQLRGRPSTLWLLRGITTCGVCRTQDGRTRACCGVCHHRGEKEYRRYRCGASKKLEPGSFCGTSVEAGQLEVMALDALRRAAGPNRLAEFARRDLEERQQNSPSPREEMTRLETALATLDEEESRIADLLLAGINRAIVQQKVDAIHQRRDRLNQELATTRARLAESATAEEAARRAEAAAERLRLALPEAERDPKVLQQLLRLFIEVRLYPDREPEIITHIPAYRLLSHLLYPGGATNRSAKDLLRL
jgi:site-specific DNA recombinase